jgi:hypothetical protein
MASESTSQHFICAFCLKDGSPSPAVTAVEGNLLCAEHAIDLMAIGRMRHD